MSAAAIATAGAANKEESAVETEKEISPTAPVHFVITSFGPFRGVAVNPTQTLLERFRARECWPTVLVETSAEAARAAVEDIYNTHRPLLKDRTVVVLHLGVNYKGRMFQIERCAFNDATFRVPDQKGLQPQNECIISKDACEHGKCFNTTLDVNRLCEDLKARGEPVVVSTDPGRFVCNYIYCLSLDSCLEENRQSGEGSQRIHSLFIHVPPFNVIPEERQFDLICRVIDHVKAVI
mmetsp:Transcript_16009/g.36932  ORF Transcript_16009/g.36932 Transcript_16009/m.36932 type:complete len:237 (-) Transcript_16009:3342-4052(-)